MANLYSQAVTYTNAGQAGATLGANYKAKAGNGLGPKTMIVSLARGQAMTQAEIDGVVFSLKKTFTIAGVDGAVGDSTIHVALQGTEALSTGAGDYFANITAAEVATFVDA
jgi:hypothetical protein